MPPAEKVTVGVYECKCGRCGHTWAYKGTPHPTPSIACPNHAANDNKGCKGTITPRELVGDEREAWEALNVRPPA